MIPIQRHPDFWRLSNTLRKFILASEDQAQQHNILEELITIPGLAESMHDKLQKIQVRLAKLKVVQ